MVGEGGGELVVCHLNFSKKMGSSVEQDAGS